MGPRIREGNGPRITALLEGRVTNARVVDEIVSEPISGVVLDIGPGLGYWVDLYARTDVPIQNAGKVVKNRGKGRGITTVYGVEPNTQSHPRLRQRALAAGLEGIYKILPVGIEDIAKETALEKGSVDAIVSLLCLCSIPEPEKNIRELYSYLKPGGRWYIYEHVKSKGYRSMQIYQGRASPLHNQISVNILTRSLAIVNWFWPIAYGGCQLCRDTEKALREAGPWSKVDLKQPPEEPWHATIPHIFGILTK